MNVIMYVKQNLTKVMKKKRTKKKIQKTEEMAKMARDQAVQEQSTSRPGSVKNQKSKRRGRDGQQSRDTEKEKEKNTSTQWTGTKAQSKTVKTGPRCWKRGDHK